MRAMKGNRVYTIDETVKEQYLHDGFDVYDDSGRLVAAGKNKMVGYETHRKLAEEHDALKKAYEDLQRKCTPVSAAKAGSKK